MSGIVQESTGVQNLKLYILSLVLTLNMISYELQICNVEEVGYRL